MKTFISHYSLNKKISGGRHQSTEGVLFKFEFEDQSVGYSLYQPIITVGDRTVQEIKHFFAKEKVTDPTCLRIIDSSKSITNFFKEPTARTPVPCYFSAGSAVEFNEEVLENEVLKYDFKTVKLKISDLSIVNFDLFIKNDLKVILDFNQKGNSLDLEKVLKDDLKAKTILYLEDPPPFINHSNTSVALDFDTGLKDTEFVVTKPTGFERKKILPKNRGEIFTSYLDHPVGQVISALSVKEPSIKFEHGLKTHRFYEENAYSEIFKPSNKFDFDFKEDLKNLLENERWVLV